MTIAAWQRWHRRIGLALALLVVLLCVTGLLLNHAGELGLDRLYPRWSWLDRRYAPAAEAVMESYAAGGHWFSRVGGRLYRDDRELAAGSTALTGVVALGEIRVLASADGLLLLDEAGDVMERLEAVHGVPAGITAAGLSADGRLVLRTASGLMAAGEDLLSWQAAGADGVAWSMAADPPPELERTLLAMHRGPGVSTERLLRDLHSGRVLGLGGAWLVDLVTLLLLFLVVSGFWIWWERSRREDD